MEFSAEDPDPEGTLMIAWIGGKSAQVADTLSDKQVVNFSSFLSYELKQIDSHDVVQTF